MCDFGLISGPAAAGAASAGTAAGTIGTGAGLTSTLAGTAATGATLGGAGAGAAAAGGSTYAALAPYLAAASAAASLAGSQQQIQGQQKAERQRQQTAAEAEAVQSKSREDALRASAEGRQGYEPENLQAEAERAGADRAEGYRRAVVSPAEYLPGQSQGGGAVRDYIDRTRGENDKFTGQQATALAELSGWSDALFGAEQRRQRGIERVSLADSASRGNAGGLASRLALAGQAGAGNRTIGDALVGAGQVGLGQTGDAWYRAFAPARSATQPRASAV